MGYWETKKDGAVFAHGPKDTVPNAVQQKQLREGGYKIVIKKTKEDSS